MCQLPTQNVIGYERKMEKCTKMYLDCKYNLTTMDVHVLRTKQHAGCISCTIWDLAEDDCHDEIFQS